MPFSSAQQSPAERVKQEEASKGSRLAGHKDTFSAQLMTHNIQVSLVDLRLGRNLGRRIHDSALLLTASF